MVVPVHVSAKTHYAAVALVELALQFDSGQPIQVRRIAEAHAIPARYLVQILLQLKAAGLVQSQRGSAGGYRLTRPPGEVSLAEVTSIIEGPSTEPEYLSAADSPASRTMVESWRRIAQAEHQLLESTTLADLASRARPSPVDMYYI